MKKPNEEIEDQLWFEDRLKDAMTQFDAVHAPKVPSLQQFEALVDDHKQEMKKRLWKELLLFWLIACFILGLMLWVLDRNVVWFAILQICIAVGGISFVTMRFRRRKVSTWKS
ncbi:YxlC family protein [Paenibacillus luteus]|uniref:YxlC family protein n=1 Tax=Paenibacillus luteus TaxID=2545753 RepID=UPI001143D210|nr:YxlC family protein [Paenibacillus luteus]